MRIHTASEFQQIDRRAATDLGVPTALLMENAGREVAVVAREKLGPRGAVYVVCGRGNNGGDGWCAARHLLSWGVSVRVLSLADIQALKGDAYTQANAAVSCGVPLVDSLNDAASGDVVVDALFGTGLSRPLEGVFAACVNEMAEARNRSARVVSVDVPSGLNADRSTPIGPHVVADLTVTLHALKVALVQHPTRAFCGEVRVAPLGLPEVDVGAPRRRWLDEDAVSGLLPARRTDSHKGTSGHLLVVAGSSGKSGAAMLACRAAMRAGAGLVTLAAPADVIERVLAQMPEVMALPMPRITQEALVDALESRTALAIGPGIEWDDATGEEIAGALQALARPAVLDADALNAIAASPEAQAVLARARVRPVLTPHPAELGRLLGSDTDSVQADRFASATDAADRFAAHVVLKGACSVIAHPDGGLDISPFENPALATAGTGDVLTGVVGALLAQGLDAESAAVGAVWVHATAGERAAGGRSRGLIASDLIERLPEALGELA